MKNSFKNFIKMEEIDIVLDVEFISSNMITGDCLQIGFVAIPHNNSCDYYKDDKWILDTLSVCFLSQDKNTEPIVMDFWKNFPDIYNRIQSEAGPISDKMNEVKIWLNSLSRKYKIKDFVSDISCVDFAWFRNLYLTYADIGNDDFRPPYSSVCTNSMEKVVKMFYTREELRNFYDSERYPHTHYALDDAIKTSYEYMKLKEFIRENLSRDFRL